MNVGDKINMDYDMNVLHICNFDMKQYLLLEPVDAPHNEHFVIMRYANDCLLPESSSVICEMVLREYFNINGGVNDDT